MGESKISKQFRFDYFLIWGNGLPFVEDIIAMIRNHDGFKILKIMCHTPETIEHLVHVVYSYDYAPFIHLKAKTEYLLSTPREVFFVFVMNQFPEEDYFGEGLYRHIESKTVKELKEAIRDRFNERKEDRRSEDHVVHASDNELQTDYILRYLGNNGISMFWPSRHLGVRAPYHIKQLRNYSVRNVPLESLTCRILAGDRNVHVPRTCHIEQSPHYRALTGEHAEYEKYIRTFMGEGLTDDHCLENFLRLRESFRYLACPHEMDYVVVRELENGKYAILDGVHRVALLRYQGATGLNVAVIGKNDDRYFKFL